MADDIRSRVHEALRENEGQEAIEKALQILAGSDEQAIAVKWENYLKLWPYEVETERVADELKGFVDDPELVDERLNEMEELGGAAREAEEAAEETGIEPAAEEETSI
ncbi:MAG: hypothetical protein SVS85_02235, partial [Candidatus Nanohaloarchaea archaeon]|nr:hypothetical protein [Candidatus Nanohaloarchaea archaeon]